MGLIIPPPPPPDIRDKVTEEIRDMLTMSESDDGMKDLLDQARVYYHLKKQPKPPEPPKRPAPPPGRIIKEHEWPWNIFKKGLG